jgi:hypothetical protein
MHGIDERERPLSLLLADNEATRLLAWMPAGRRAGRPTARRLLLRHGGAVAEEVGPVQLVVVRSGSEFGVRETALVPRQRPSTDRLDRRRRE